MTQLINDFLIKVNEQKISYVHWKNNSNIEHALSNDDDLNLLFEHTREKEVKSILALLNIVEVDSSKNNWQPGTKSYIGFDSELNKLIHFHLHFKLPVGYNFDKNTVLPVESNYLKPRHKNPLNKIFKYNSFGKVPTHGGRIFAFVGGDGAGKSTIIDLLKNTLSKHFKIQVINVGRPNNSVLGTALRISKKIFSIFISNNMNLALNYIALAIDRHSEFKRACKLREKGYIVLLKHIPLKGITAMDCPRIRINLGNKFEFLSRFEEAIYQKINGVDELFVLKLDPEIALLRKPEVEPSELRFRSGQIWNNDWIAPYAKVIDTGITNVEEIQRKILDFINKSLCKKYDFIEIIGLNGTGKSTLINEIKSKHANVTSTMPIKKYKSFLFISSLVSIPWFFKAYVKTQNIEVSKNVLHLFSSIMIIKYWKLINYKPASHFILDQGPFFHIALLRKENVLKSDFFEKSVNSYIKNIIYLSADHNVLWKRVKNRKNQPCRSQNMNKIEFINFCSLYNREYNSLSSQHIKKIDTSNISPIELLNVLSREEVICK